MQGVGVKIAGELFALQAGEREADAGFMTLGAQARKVLDEDSPGQAVLGDKGVVFPKLGWHADIGLVFQPDEMEAASPVLQLGEECLHGVDSMQELEAIWAGGARRLVWGS